MRKRVWFGLLFALLVLAGQDPATWTLAQKEHFLLTATIENVTYAGKGLTNSQKATLTEDGVSHAAHIQHIDISQPLFKGKDGSTKRIFGIAENSMALPYRLAKLLQLTNMVPVSVSRVVDGKPRSVDWWVDGVMMDERERITNIQPPDPIDGASKWTSSGCSIS